MSNHVIWLIALSCKTPLGDCVCVCVRGFYISIWILCSPSYCASLLELSEKIDFSYSKTSRCSFSLTWQERGFLSKSPWVILTAGRFHLSLEPEQITTVKPANSPFLLHYLHRHPRWAVFSWIRLSLVQDNVIWHLNRTMVGNESCLRSYWVSAHIIIDSFLLIWSVLWDVTWQEIRYTDIWGLCPGF